VLAAHLRNVKATYKTVLFASIVTAVWTRNKEILSETANQTAQ
jgi:hypothetical protein